MRARLPERGARLLRRRSVRIAAGVALLAVVLASRLEITNPRVHVRWREDTGIELRQARERRYGLRDGSQVDGTTWAYRLGKRTEENIRALIQDPAVEDTGYINRETVTAGPREVRILWYPFSDLFARPSQLVRLHQSAWLLLAAGGVLWAARSSSRRVRRNTAMASFLFVGVMAVALPLDPAVVTMGGSAERANDREDFERFYGGRVRYEKHLSQVLMLELYRLDPSEESPRRALVALSRGATLWFVLPAVAVGALEGWSALSLRYLGLALLAPSALLYFGWREFGYLSLSVAIVPLLMRGLRDDGMRLEAGTAVAGFGAALHGTGLVSLAGAWLASLGASGRVLDRVRRVLRVTAWGIAAYLGWIALYEVVLRLPITPDPGPEAFSSWRRLFVDDVRGGRVAAALFSPTGARDLLMTVWVAGAPLLFVAGSLWRRHAHEVRTALWYAVPSMAFVIFRWPYDGVGGGMDLVAGGFPALYALAWVCAHDSRRTSIAAVLLISAHYAFWRVVLDRSFIPVDAFVR